MGACCCATGLPLPFRARSLVLGFRLSAQKMTAMSWQGATRNRPGASRSVAKVALAGALASLGKDPRLCFMQPAWREALLASQFMVLTVFMPRGVRPRFLSSRAEHGLTRSTLLALEDYGVQGSIVAICSLLKPLRDEQCWKETWLSKGR